MTNSVQSTPLEPQHISCVAEAQLSETVNAYLALGWVIVGMSSNHYSEHGYSLNFHLGWSRKLGEPKHPPKPDWKTVFGSGDQLSEDEASSKIPF